MDAGHFDLLTKSLSRAGARRLVLRGLAMLPLGGGLAWLAGDEAGDAAKRRKRTRKARRQKRRKRHRTACYPGKSCTPGAGNDNAGCDFAESVVFFERDFQDANFSQANFTGAQLARADLRGANLSGACLVGANLLNATLDETTNLEGAIFCRTLMPDGAIDDSGCDQGTRCCPTGCQGETCPTTCEDRRGEICSVVGFPAPLCCQPYVCTPGLILPFVTSCQLPCTSDEQCQSVLPGTVCSSTNILCPYLARCCVYP